MVENTFTEIKTKDKHILYITDLETLIEDGIVSIFQDRIRNSGCFVFTRTFKDIEMFVADEKTWPYINVDKSKKGVDDKSLSDLNYLRSKLKQNLPIQNIVNEHMDWTETGISDSSKDDYVEAFHEEISRNIMMITQRHLNKYKPPTDDLYTEVISNWHIAKEHTKYYLGREEELEMIKAYLLDTTNQSLIVKGPLGSGKSALLAVAAVQSNQWTEELNDMTHVIIRFIGNKENVDVSHLLSSICHQVANVTGQYRHQLPLNSIELKRHFMEIIQRGIDGHHLVLYLDGLDELSTDNAAHRLDWLPPRTAPNVKIILSTKSDSQVIIWHLEEGLNNDTRIIELDGMTPNVAAAVLEQKLESKNRLLQYPQWNLLKDSFEINSRPLFVDLVSHLALKWKSYGEVPVGKNISIDNICEHIFEHLDQIYGRELVKHVTGFLTVSKYGLSDTEMNDVLSLDNIALNQFYGDSEPKVMRIPTLLWLEIKHELKGCLIEKLVDDVNVVNWKYPIFETIAKKRYFRFNNDLFYLHNILGEYYIAKWNNWTEKPYTFKDTATNTLSKKNYCRYIIDQPNTYALKSRPTKANSNLRRPSRRHSSFDSIEVTNLRRINCLPYHVRAANHDIIYRRDILFNYAHIRNKIMATSIQDVLDDYYGIDDKEVELMANAIKFAEPSLIENINVLGIELTGRLLPHYHKFQFIRMFIDACDLQALHYNPIIPNCQLFHAPGSATENTLTLNRDYKCKVDVDLFRNGDYLLVTAKPVYSSTLKLWDLKTGLPKADVFLDANSELSPTPNGKYIILTKNNKFAHIYKTGTGELWKQVDYGYGHISDVSVSNKHIILSLKKVPSPIVIDIELGKIVHKFSYQTNESAVSQDGKYMVFNPGNLLVFHALDTMERMCVIKGNSVPKKIQFSNYSNTRFYVMFESNYIAVYTVDIEDRSAKSSNLVRDNGMINFKQSNNEQLVLVMCCRYLYLINSHTEKLVHRLQTMPAGVNIGNAIFTGFGFSPDDSMVIASRDMFIVIWETKTGCLMRLLRGSLSPIKRLFTDTFDNRIVSLTKNNQLQVWNLNNLKTDLLKTNEIVIGEIKKINLSKEKRRMVCCVTGSKEVTVADCKTATPICKYEHKQNFPSQVKDVLISTNGNYVISRAEMSKETKSKKPWELLTEDMVWNIEKKEELFRCNASKYSAVSPSSKIVVFLQVRSMQPKQWWSVVFSVVTLTLDTLEETVVDFTEGNIITQPFFTFDEDKIVFTKFQTVSGSSVESLLVVHELTTNLRESKIHNLKDMVTTCCDKDYILQAKPSQSTKNNVVLIYGKSFDVQYTDDGDLKVDSTFAKGLVIFDLDNETTVQHIKSYLKPNSCLDDVILSKAGDIAVDGILRVFDVKESTVIHEHKNLVLNTPRAIVLNGEYIIGTSNENISLMQVSTGKHSIENILLIQAATGKCCAKFPTHGIVTTMAVFPDDRTVVAGTMEGRVLIFTVIVDLSDPKREVINFIPSRTLLSGTNDMVRSATMVYEQKQNPLSTRKVGKKGIMRFKAAATGVIISNKQNGSAACSVQ